MEFRILGPLEVLVDRAALDLGGAKQRTLLAVLLLEANRVVARERLIDAVWEDDPPETATKALQVYVSQLRKLLGRDRVETKAPGYRLRVEQGELDLDRFLELRRQGRFPDALALWRGSPLADFGSQRFAHAEIARLEEVRLACIEDRVDDDLAAGRHADVVAELEALVGEHPLRQRLRGQLMLALYRSGRDAEALDVYHDARRALVDELGIEPPRELRELQQAILRQDPALDRAPGAEADGAAARPTFVGRDQELARLHAGLDECLSGHGRLFLLVGEPGIGKSRLADELIGAAKARGARVLVGRCWEAGGAPAYWPWVQALRAYVDEIESRPLRSQLAAGAVDLVHLVPELRDRFPDLPEPSSLEAESARFRLFDATARFLRNAAAAKPLVLVLDDLHAADEPSLLLLRFVAGELADSRILVVGTYRDVDPTVRDPLASTLVELAREQVTRRIELDGLREEDVASYVELASGVAPPSGVAATIHAETGGNALFVSEVVRLLAAEGRIAEIGAGDLWALGIPQGVREVIGRRLRRLSEECAQVLTLASILGREFGLDALQRLAGLTADGLLEVLDEAVAARMVTSVPDARGRLRFAHALIRETLYDELTTPRRVQLHRRAAEALEALYAADPGPHLAELAYHFFEAAPGGDVARALEYAERAGDRALELLAYEEAARFYEQALQTLELLPQSEPAVRCELLVHLGDSLSRAGSAAEAKERFVAAADLAREARLDELFVKAVLGYGGRFPWVRAGTDPLLIPLLEEALALTTGDTSTLRVRVLGRLSGALRDEPSLERRTALSEEAEAIARELGDVDSRCYAVLCRALARWGPDVAEFAALAAEGRRLAEEIDDAEQILQSMWPEYIASLTLVDPVRTVLLAAEYGTLADERGLRVHQWYAAALNSHRAMFEGRYADGERLMEEALRLGERAQSWDAGFSYRCALFGLRREQGRLAEIEDVIRRSVDEYPGYRSVRCLVLLLEWELGRRDDARRTLDELARNDFGLFPLDSEWLFCLSVLGEVAAGLRHRAYSETLYGRLLPYAGLNATAAGEYYIGSVARYLGLLGTTLGRRQEPEAHFEQALEMNERMGAHPWLAHTQEDFGRMLLERGGAVDRGRGGELLRAALAGYRALGLEYQAARLAP